jgi:hypothetical protein
MDWTGNQQIDDAYNDAHPLSSLRSPTQTNASIGPGDDPDRRRPKRLKTKHFSPILFVKINLPSGKKKRAQKSRIIKALVDCGAGESIITEQASKNLKRKVNPKIQKWTTAAGQLDTAAQTRKTEFSFPELHANKLIYF